MSRSPEWWHEQLSSFLERSASLLVARIGRRARSVFLCGSFSMDEGSVVLETDSPIVLSDVDLVVVVDSLEDAAAWYRRRGELGAACEALLPDVRFAGRVDVGVMMTADLERLPARPGVYDMRARGRVLAGDPEVLGRIPAFDPSAIGAAEAILLIENRIAALLGEFPSEGRDPDAYPFLYAIARTYTDIAVAVLSLAGRYRPGYRERAAALAALAAQRTAGVSRFLTPALLRGVERWTAFKLDPRSNAAGASAVAPRMREAWLEAAGDILLFWRSAAAQEVLLPAGDEAPPPADEILRRRSRGRIRRSNLVMWRSLLDRMAPASRVAIVAGMRSGILSRAPLDVVREESIRLLAGLVSGDAARRRERPPGGFPHGGGAWQEAAARTAAVWRELVFGRTEE